MDFVRINDVSFKHDWVPNVRCHISIPHLMPHVRSNVELDATCHALEYSLIAKKMILFE